MKSNDSGLCVGSAGGNTIYIGTHTQGSWGKRSIEHWQVALQRAHHMLGTNRSWQVGMIGKSLGESSLWKHGIVLCPESGDKRRKYTMIVRQV
jgi:hypothetical protein